MRRSTSVRTRMTALVALAAAALSIGIIAGFMRPDPGDVVGGLGRAPLAHMRPDPGDVVPGSRLGG
jgi:hypothetical protein